MHTEGTMMRLVDRQNPSRRRLAALVVLGIVITAAFVLLFGGDAKADPPGEFIGPSTGHEQVHEVDERCARAVSGWFPSPTLGFDCTKLGQDIEDEVVVTVGGALSSCAAGAWFGGPTGCYAAAAGSLATAWTAWID